MHFLKISKGFHGKPQEQKKAHTRRRPEVEIL
jgi:hypothetical protein